MRERDGRHCDRCGGLLTRKNNRCGFELCDTCNDALELQVKIKKLGSDFLDGFKKGLAESEDMEWGMNNDRDNNIE